MENAVFSLCANCSVFALGFSGDENDVFAAGKHPSHDSTAAAGTHPETDSG